MAYEEQASQEVSSKPGQTIAKRVTKPEGKIWKMSSWLCVPTWRTFWDPPTLTMELYNLNFVFASLQHGKTAQYYCRTVLYRGYKYFHMVIQSLPKLQSTSVALLSTFPPRTKIRLPIIENFLINKIWSLQHSKNLRLLVGGMGEKEDILKVKTLFWRFH